MVKLVNVMRGDPVVIGPNGLPCASQWRDQCVRFSSPNRKPACPTISSLTVRLLSTLVNCAASWSEFSHPLDVPAGWLVSSGPKGVATFATLNRTIKQLYQSIWLTSRDPQNSFLNATRIEQLNQQNGVRPLSTFGST